MSMTLYFIFFLIFVLWYGQISVLEGIFSFYKTVKICSLKHTRSQGPTKFFAAYKQISRCLQNLLSIVLQSGVCAYKRRLLAGPLCRALRVVMNARNSLNHSVCRFGPSLRQSIHLSLHLFIRPSVIQCEFTQKGDLICVTPPAHLHATEAVVYRALILHSKWDRVCGWEIGGEGGVVEAPGRFQ